jgi:hypothetical protein
MDFNKKSGFIFKCIAYLLVLSFSVTSTSIYASYSLEHWVGSGSNTDGNGLNVRLNEPVAMDHDANGNIYLADKRYSSVINKITPAGDVTRFAGGNTSFNSQAYGDSDSNGFLYLMDIVYDQSSDHLFVLDMASHNTYNEIAMIDVDGNSSKVMGKTDGLMGNASYAITVDSLGNLYYDKNEPESSTGTTCYLWTCGSWHTSPGLNSPNGYPSEITRVEVDSIHDGVDGATITEIYSGLYSEHANTAPHLVDKGYSSMFLDIDLNNNLYVSGRNGLARISSTGEEILYPHSKEGQPFCIRFIR